MQKIQLNEFLKSMYLENAILFHFRDSLNVFVYNMFTASSDIEPRNDIYEFEKFLHKHPERVTQFIIDFTQKTVPLIETIDKEIRRVHSYDGVEIVDDNDQNRPIFTIKNFQELYH